MHRVKVAIAAFMTAALGLGASDAKNVRRNGTVPTVGGHSNAFDETSRNGRGNFAVSRKGGFTTVGIVVKVRGGAFKAEAANESFEPLKVGNAVRIGDQVTVPQGSSLHIADTRGRRFTLLGGGVAYFESSNRVVLYRGSLRVRNSNADHPLQVQTAILTGSVNGSAVFWVSSEKAQLFAINGEVQAWHPSLSQSKVNVPAGSFTEYEKDLEYLQPAKPIVADSDETRHLLAKFDEGVRFADHEAVVIEDRAPAAELPVLSVNRGSRVRNDVVEEVNKKSLEKLNTKMLGLDSEDSNTKLWARGPAPGRKVASSGSAPRAMSPAELKKLLLQFRRPKAAKH